MTASAATDTKSSGAAASRRRMGELSCLSPEHVNFNSQRCGSIGLYFKKMPSGIIVVRQEQFEHVVTRCC